MRKETIEKVIATSTLGLAATASIAAAPAENQSIFTDDFAKAGISLLMATEIAGTTLIGWRYSDGARTQLEEKMWKYFVPITNTLGIAALLKFLWL